MKKLTALILIQLCAINAAEAGANLYVDTAGDDKWTGTISHPNLDQKDGPLRTLAGAQRVSKEILANNPNEKEILIKVAPGTYSLSNPMIFTEEDTRTTTKIIYEGNENGSTYLTGGRSIEQWRSADKLWISNSAPPNIASLYLNGIRLIPAKSPNTGYYHMEDESEIEKNSDDQTRKTKFKANLQDIIQLKNLSAEDLAKVTITLYHSWQISIHHIKSIDFTNGVVTLKTPSPWPIKKWDSKQRYTLAGFEGALDAPGEWMIRSNGELVYYPQKNEKIESSLFVAPISQGLLSIKGIKEKIKNIQFKNINLEYSAIPPIGTEYKDRIGSPKVISAIEIENAENVTIEKSSITKSDGYGIWLRKASKNISIDHNQITDMGAGGIKIGEEQFPEREFDKTENNRITNNSLTKLGRTYPGANGIWIGHSGGNLISHNLIGDLYYSGISVGWSVGYKPSVAQNNRIEFNRIKDVGQSILSDMGGIYTLGPLEGTTITGNVIENVFSYDYGGWGIYNDEGTSGVTIKNNLVFNTKSGGYHLHFGKDVIVENNIFATSAGPQATRTKPESFFAIRFERNILYNSNGPEFYGIWDKNTDNKNNFLVNVASQKNKSTSSQPSLFVNINKNDFRLAPNSVPANQGFVPFDPNLAGPQN